MTRVKYSIKKDDTVVVIAGKDSGKRGKVIRLYPNRASLLVEKVNIVKRHLRPGPEGKGGGIVEKESPISISNVGYLCTKCDGPVRIMKKKLDDGRKVRACRKCGEILDK